MSQKINFSSLNLSLLLLVGCSFSSYADEAVPVPDSGLMMRENKKLPEQPQKQSDVGIEKPESARPVMLPQNDLRVTINNFQLTGNTLFSHAELEVLLDSSVHDKNLARLGLLVKRQKTK